MTTVLVVAAPPARRVAGRLTVGASAPALALNGLRDELETIASGVRVEFRQTDDEAQLISWLQDAADQGWGVVLDPAAFRHYSYALRDAAALVTAAGLPLIEVHPTNPTSRGDSATSVVSAVSTGVIAGLGLDSYRFAVQAAAARLPTAARPEQARS